MTSRRQARAALSNELTPDMVPDHVRFFRMERYREVIAAKLRERPGDVFAAGMEAFRAWCDERNAFERQHGIDSPDDWRMRADLLGATTGPDFMWICREFGIEERDDWKIVDPRSRK